MLQDVSTRKLRCRLPGCCRKISEAPRTGVGGGGGVSVAIAPEKKKNMRPS